MKYKYVVTEIDLLLSGNSVFYVLFQTLERAEQYISRQLTGSYTITEV